MATSYKVLGQAALAATTNTTIYTVPAGKQTIVSNITICNRSATAGTYRIAIVKSGETLADKHYVVYDVSLPGNDATFLQVGLNLAAGDFIVAYSAVATLSVTASGAEITV